MSNDHSLKSLFDGEARPSPVEVGAALAEYCTRRSHDVSDDRQIVAILNRNGYTATADVAAHVAIPVQGNTIAEIRASMAISYTMTCLRIGAAVPQLLINGMRPF